MRIASRWVLVSAVALCVAGMASAQNPGGGNRRGGGGAGQPGRGGFGGGMMGGGAAILGVEAVQKELKLTDEQKTKVKEFTDAQREKMREAFGGGQPDREKLQEMMKAGAEASEKFVKDTLNADQQKRFKQIEAQVSLQRMGPAALTSDANAKALSLTDDQKEKIKGLADEYRKDRQDLMGDLQGGGDAATEARKKMQSLTKDYVAKATDVLTSDQKKQWKDMTGEPFEMPQMQGRGGRGGQGGAGGRNRGGNNPPPPPA